MPLVELRCNVAYLVQRSSTNKQNKPKEKNAYLGPAWVPLQLQPLPCSKLAPAQRLWSSGDGVRGGGVGRW
jgi:hypothetical protein